MKKVLINNDYGGFNISSEALLLLIQKESELVLKVKTNTAKGEKYKGYIKTFGGGLVKDGVYYSIDTFDNRTREHKDLNYLFKEININGQYSNIIQVEVPDNCVYEILENDGKESIIIQDVTGLYCTSCGSPLENDVCNYCSTRQFIKTI